MKTIRPSLVPRSRLWIRTGRFLLIVAFLGMLCSCLYAQSTASLSGTISDATGAVIPGSVVLLKNTGTGLTYTAKTDASGTYRFPTLPIGNYELSASHDGFSAEIVRNIVLVTGRAAAIPVSLHAGAVSQTVSVTEGTQEVQPTSSEVQTTVEHKSMEDLPLNTRNPLDLLLHMPGAISQGDSQSFQQANTRITVNGNRGTDNGYRLDGVLFTDTHFGTSPLLPNPDALEEFTVKTTNFGAEESGAGASVEFTTRSGTNKFHGTLFEYLRNNALDARSYFSTVPVLPYRRNQYGGTAGGPIFRDRTFFFFAFQGTRLVGGASPAQAVVPDAAERTGDFSELLNTSKPTIIYNPTTGVAYPNNVINTPLDPVTQKYLSYIPLPNSPNNIYQSAPRSNSSEDQYMLRLDHQLTRKDRLTARFFYDGYNFQSQSSTLTAFYGVNKFLTRNLVVSETHTFNSHFILSGAFGYTNSGRTTEGVTPITAQSAGANVPVATPGIPDQSILSISGFASLSSSSPIDIVPKSYDYLSHIIWVHGNHQITAGVELLRNIEDAFDHSSGSGVWAFNGSRTESKTSTGGNGFADFLLGLPNNFTQKGTSPQQIYETKIQPWIQDDWRASRKLTINMGVRWDPWLPATDRVAPQVGFEPGVQSTIALNAPVGMVFSGDAGLPHAIFHRDMNNIAPRIGFAYDVFGNASTVFRGAYGIFYRPMPLNLQRFSSNTAAFRTLTVQITNPQSFENPYATYPGGTPFPWTVPEQSQLRNYAFTLPVTTSGLKPNSSLSYVQEWTATLEHQFSHQIGVAATYVGNHMIKGMDATEGNPGVYGPGATTGNINSRRLYAGLASVETVGSFNFSNYNGLQLTANKHAAQGWTLISNFTWSKCMDNDSTTTGVVTVINKFNLKANYARCDWDVEESGSVMSVYDLPAVHAFRGIADRALNHWQLSTIAGAAKGQPFDILSGTDRALSGATTNSSIWDLVDKIPGVSPQRVSGVSQLDGYFNKAAYTPAALGTFGNSGRNSSFGPGSWTVTLAVLKNFPIYERLNATFRVEAFNVFNHTNFGSPVATYTNANFGKITSSDAPRVIQASLRVSF